MGVLSHSVHTGLFVENVEQMVRFYRDIGVPTKADVDREYMRLMALGVLSAQEPKTQPWGQRDFWITDPEGNYIEVGSFQD